ncbi:MAG: 2-hydroxyacid dehydrogenase [Pseudomonadota bacterium]|nr:2-hydroxyacid dehydrogenase [Pseudomonadota bacterium]
MPAPGMAVIAERIAQRATLHRPFEAPDPAAALAEVAPRIRALVVTHHTPRIDDGYLAQFPQLEIVTSFGVGYDHIDARAAGARGIVVAHTPGVLDAETADTGFGLLLNAVRRLPAAERYLREGRWSGEGPFPLSASLRGRTMGVLGLGRIGKEIARRALAFGVEVVYHGRKAQADAPYLYYPSLLAMAKAVDILMIAAPGGADTRHIVNAEVLAALGENGVLVNIARGSLVDDEALIAALRGRKILAAGLDVFAHEPQVPPAYLELDNVVLTPHVGSATIVTRLAMANLVVDNLFAFMDGKGPIAPTPETPWPPARR